MSNEDKELFRYLCFIVLMQGLESKSPKYIREKIGRVKDVHIWQGLDMSKRMEVIAWCQHWDKPIFDWLRELDLDLAAAM